MNQNPFKPGDTVKCIETRSAGDGCKIIKDEVYTITKVTGTQVSVDDSKPGWNYKRFEFFTSEAEKKVKDFFNKYGV